MDIKAADTKLLSEDKRSRISFLVLEVQTERYPSANLLVEVMDNEFCGWDAVWFGADTWNAFVEQLRQCERTRRGSASLAHGAFVELMRVESSDSAGHFVARYNIARGRGLSGGANATATLTGAFVLDSEFFGQMVSDFSPLAERATRISEQNAAA